MVKEKNNMQMYKCFIELSLLFQSTSFTNITFCGMDHFVSSAKTLHTTSNICVSNNYVQNKWQNTALNLETIH